MINTLPITRTAIARLAKEWARDRKESAKIYRDLERNNVEICGVNVTKSIAAELLREMEHMEKVKARKKKEDVEWWDYVRTALKPKSQDSK